MAEMEAGLASGELLSGTLQVLRSNPSNGFVQLDGYRPPPGAASSRSRSFEGSVMLTGREAMNRTMHGDKVALRLLRSRLTTPTPAAAAAAGGGGGEESWGGESSLQRRLARGLRWLLGREEPRASAGAAGTPTGASSGEAAAPEQEAGAIVGLLARREAPVTVTIDPTAPYGKTAGRWFCVGVPLDPRLPKLSLKLDSHPESMEGQLLLARVGEWAQGNGYPSAELVRSLGFAGSAEAETEAILSAHECSLEPWSAAVEACLPPADFSISASEIAKRLDLRDEMVCSIDPPNCRDIDDALHVKKLSDGTHEVGVHIADVCHFISAGSALDAEAAKRAETFYLVNTTVEMVPKRLSEDLCSLVAEKDRLAFSVIWNLDDAANILSTKFAKSVIRSSASLSYKEAQSRIDSGPSDDALTSNLRVLDALARRLRERRAKRGALFLASPERKFELETDERGLPRRDSEPTKMGVHESVGTNSLIEEFMVLANVSVAKELAILYPKQTLLRRHPKPDDADFESLDSSLQKHGFRFDGSSKAAIVRSLDSCAKAEQPFFNHFVRILATRCMQPAKYFCSHSLEEHEWEHCGLAEPTYAHFTSPIRRYADHHVHRLLAHSIGWEPLPETGSFTPDAIEGLCTGLNERHTLAQNAERASVELFTLIYFRDRKVEEEAYVIKIQEAGALLLVPRYGIEGFAYVGGPPAGDDEDAPLRSVKYDERKQALTSNAAGGDKSRALRALDRVRVNISVFTNRLLRPRLVLDIVSPQGFGAPPMPQWMVAPPAGGASKPPSAGVKPTSSSRGGKPTSGSRFKRSKLEIEVEAFAAMAAKGARRSKRDTKRERKKGHNVKKEQQAVNGEGGATTDSGASRTDAVAAEPPPPKTKVAKVDAAEVADTVADTVADSGEEKKVPTKGSKKNAAATKTKAVASGAEPNDAPDQKVAKVARKRAAQKEASKPTEGDGGEAKVPKKRGRPPKAKAADV